VIAYFDDPPLVDDQDPVSATNRGEPMRDDE
jgi:hypothetical protein